MNARHPAYLELDAIRKSFSGSIAVDGVTLSVDRGERLALLGPSGCGKTTTLNIVAGFFAPDSGRVRVAALDIGHLPAHRRNTGMVFQQYALFPHLSVAKNIAFGLRMRGIEKPEIARRVSDALALVRLQSLAERLPRELSGGQQQRVALARALVIKPDILLLDEPLSNLDAKLRREMRTEMLSLLDSVGVTTILVTHDQEEALALASRIAVMNMGRVEQIGSPNEVYDKPATPFVARFLGDPNVIRGRVIQVQGANVICDVGLQKPLIGTSNVTIDQGANVDILIRSERIQLVRDADGFDNVIPVKLEHTIFLGNTIRYLMRANDHVLASVENNQGQTPKTSACEYLVAAWSAKDTLVFPV
jgi:spermidine/putrescine ABC transporter ATP-binding subunit